MEKAQLLHNLHVPLQTMNMSKPSYDIVICGGGLAGCTLASRLSVSRPDLQVALIEAGGDVSQHPVVPIPIAAPSLLGTELDWNFETVPQKKLDNRPREAHAGKALSGGAVLNFGKLLTILRSTIVIKAQ